MAASSLERCVRLARIVLPAFCCAELVLKFGGRCNFGFNPLIILTRGPSRLSYGEAGRRPVPAGFVHVPLRYPVSSGCIVMCCADPSVLLIVVVVVWWCVLFRSSCCIFVTSCFGTLAVKKRALPS